jgi:hypothetical protein
MAIRMLIVIVALALCLAPATLSAKESAGGDMASDVGIGAASFLVSLPYGGAKVAMALVGGLAGGFTYPFDQQAAESVWHTTMEGDYIVTPDHLRGKKELHFIGTPPESSRNSHGLKGG